MREKTKKATFNLNAGVLAELDRAVAEGEASSKNAFVEEALIKELNERKRKARKKLWQEAAKDPLFLKDIKEVEADFRAADAETAGRTD